MDYNNGLNQILGYISKTKFWGIIPLDIVSHVVVSIMLTIVGIKLKISYLKICCGILTCALLKEFYDSFVLTSTWIEHIKDIVVTMIFPFALGIVRYYLSRLSQNIKLQP